MSNHGLHRSLPHRWPHQRPGHRPEGVRAMHDVEAIVLLIVCLGLMYGFVAGFERL
jgi:hypothetical protein